MLDSIPALQRICVLKEASDLNSFKFSKILNFGMLMIVIMKIIIIITGRSLNYFLWNILIIDFFKFVCFIIFKQDFTHMKILLNDLFKVYLTGFSTLSNFNGPFFKIIKMLLFLSCKLHEWYDLSDVLAIFRGHFLL